MKLQLLFLFLQNSRIQQKEITYLKLVSVIKLVSHVSVLLIPTLPVNLDYVGIHWKEESALD